MKKNFYALLLLFITHHAVAQLEKGLFSLGISPEYYSPPTYDESNYFKKRSMNSTIDFRSQYFFMKNLAAEIGLIHYYDRNISSTYTSTSSTTYRTDRKNVSNSLGLSLGINHYHPIQNRLYFKTSLNYTHYKSKYRTEILSPNDPLEVYPGTPGKSNSLNLNANLFFFLSKKFTLDLKLGGLRHAFAKDGMNYTQVSFKPSNWTIGLSYYPNAKADKKRKNIGADSVSNVIDTKKNIEADTISRLTVNDNVLKGRTFFFPNGTPLDAGEVYIEPNIIPLETILLVPMVDIGLGKGFSVTVAPMLSLLDINWDNYYLLANLKYARRVSGKWSVSANTILWTNIYDFDKKTRYDNYLIPTLAATRTGRKSELSFGLGMSFGFGFDISGKAYLANIGYMHKIGKRWAYTTDNLFHINKYDDISLVSSHMFKYHVNKRFNFDFGVIGFIDLSEFVGIPLPALKASYHFPGKRNKAKASNK
jgi:hypothetical protein